MRTRERKNRETERKETKNEGHRETKKINTIEMREKRTRAVAIHFRRMSRDCIIQLYLLSHRVHEIMDTINDD